MSSDKNLQHTALIIDDEEDICFLLTSILKKINIRPSHVHNLAQANAILERTHPEIIFLDNYLPDGKGLLHIQDLKSKNPAAKIILITAHDSSEDRQRALQTGADDFLGKPLSTDSIHQSIHRLIGVA